MVDKKKELNLGMVITSANSKDIVRNAKFSREGFSAGGGGGGVVGRTPADPKGLLFVLF